MKSILNGDRVCYICETTLNLHKHHIFAGTANRKLSEQYGCWVYLCAYHHNASDHSVHANKELDLWLKRVAQIRFEKMYSRQKFIEVFGRNYL